jgi:hypothetical protein
LGDDDIEEEATTRPYPAINTVALRNMESLTQVTIIGLLFCNASEQAAFTSSLSPSLEGFTFIGRLSGDKWPDDKLVNIGGSKKIVWSSQCDGVCFAFLESLEIEFLDPMWDILIKSQTNVETLSLPFLSRDLSVSQQLWKFHFPRLRSLTLGNWGFDWDVSISTVFANFIFNHRDTLEELKLHHNIRDYVIALAFNDIVFHPNSFPHLSSFERNIFIYRAMTCTNSQDLATNLRRLLLTNNRIGMQNYIMPLLDLAPPFWGNLNNCAHLALKELDIGLPSVVQKKSNWSDNQVMAVARALAQLFPALEVWKGTFPGSVKMEAGDFATPFSLFGRLRTIHIDVTGQAPRFPGTLEDDDYVVLSYVNAWLRAAGSFNKSM